MPLAVSTCLPLPRVLRTVGGNLGVKERELKFVLKFGGAAGGYVYCQMKRDVRCGMNIGV